MRIKLPHVPYVSHKIAIDLLNCGFVKLNKGIEPIVAKASEILTTDVQRKSAGRASKWAFREKRGRDANYANRPQKYVLAR